MILSDKAIRAMAESGMLISENYSEKSLTPNGYDLRISDVMYSGNRHEEVSVKTGGQFFISTMEKMKIPENIAGMLWMRSSYSRKGLFGSFGFVDAGFEGSLTLSFFRYSDDARFHKLYDKINHGDRDRCRKGG